MLKKASDSSIVAAMITNEELEQLEAITQRLEHNLGDRIEAAENRFDERMRATEERLQAKITEDAQAIKADLRALDKKLDLIAHVLDSDVVKLTKRVEHLEDQVSATTV